MANQTTCMGLGHRACYPSSSYGVGGGVGGGGGGGGGVAVVVNFLESKTLTRERE